MNYRMTVYTVTPLHIGSGEILLRGYDYVSGKDRTFVLDRDAVLSAEYDKTGRVPTKAPGELIAASELREESPFVRYAMAGTTRIEQMHEQVKDIHGQLYIPGSSLKGALRTILFAHALETKSFTPNPNTLGEKQWWAAKEWERAAFGENPNKDLMRIVQVADTNALKATITRLRLLDAQVFQASNGGSPITVEAIADKVLFETIMHLDDYLLKPAQIETLGWGSKTEWLKRIPELAQQRARARIADEKRFAAQNGWTNAVKVYEQLETFQPKPGQFLVQMGWGMGYSGATIGLLVEKQQQVKLRERYNLGRPPHAPREWRVNPDTPFPKSRRMRVGAGVNANAVPDRPLGWVVVSLEQK